MSAYFTILLSLFINTKDRVNSKTQTQTFFSPPPAVHSAGQTTKQLKITNYCFPSINSTLYPSPSALLTRDQRFLNWFVISLKAVNKLHTNLKRWERLKGPREGLDPRPPGHGDGSQPRVSGLARRAPRRKQNDGARRRPELKGSRGLPESLTSRIPRLLSGAALHFPRCRAPGEAGSL